MKGIRFVRFGPPIAVKGVCGVKWIPRLLVSYRTLASPRRPRPRICLGFKICALVSILRALNSLPAQYRSLSASHGSYHLHGLAVLHTPKSSVPRRRRAPNQP